MFKCSINLVYKMLLLLSIINSVFAGTGINSTGITFPDGSVQTTAAGESSCTPVTQADVPMTITVPGVYCLVENVKSGMAAFTIEANNVILNLNGHTVDGSSAGTDTFQNGVNCLDRLNPVVTNGTITGYKYGTSYSNCDGGQVTHVRLTKNYVSGVDVYNGSEGVLIANNHIYDIGGTTRDGN